MQAASPHQKVAENIWVLRFPLSLLGTRLGRTVTVIRLDSGELVIHSTSPFAPAGVTAIKALGRPAWLIEATLFHDTFAEAGRAALPDIPYLVPDGFPSRRGGTNPLRAPPPAWAGNLAMLPLDGMTKVREHVFLHLPSRTLIVADLVFNFGPQATAWTRWFFRWPAGIRQYPGISRIFVAGVRDRTAFASSVSRMMQWDFDRLIVGHGEIFESGAKPKLAAALAAKGF